MRDQPEGCDTNRQDILVSQLQGLFHGREALIVAGGASSANWDSHYRNGMIVIAVNGSISSLGNRADVSIVMEPTARACGDGWYGCIPDRVLKVQHVYNFISNDKQTLLPRPPNTCMAVRSHHKAGWDARRYINPHPAPRNFEQLYEEAYDYYRFLPAFEEMPYYERGLLKGPVTQVKLREPIYKKSGTRYELRNAVGTTSLCALHLAAYLGCERILSTGMDFCFADSHHWYEAGRYDRYEEGAGVYTRPECMNVIAHGGWEYHTFWWFTSAAAYIAREIKPELERQGITWTDKSSGLLQIPGISDVDYLDGTSKQWIQL